MLEAAIVGELPSDPASAEKPTAARGRLAISDIISEQELPEGITCDATIWASCIGGAMQVDRCKAAIEASGMRIISIRENPQYQFLSKSAQGASKKYGVKSVSLLAKKL